MELLLLLQNPAISTPGEEHKGSDASPTRVVSRSTSALVAEISRLQKQVDELTSAHAGLRDSNEKLSSLNTKLKTSNALLNQENKFLKQVCVHMSWIP